MMEDIRWDIQRRNGDSMICRICKVFGVLRYQEFWA